MIFWSGPLARPHLKLFGTFEGVVRGGRGGMKNVKKNAPPFFWVQNLESFGFFRFHAEKVFPGPDSMGFVWGGVGRALVQVMHFSAIFVMWAVLATSVTPCYQV